MAKGRIGVRIPESVKKQRQSAFLEAYVTCSTVTGAARATGEADTTHYEWVKDPEYAAAFVEAEKRAIAHLETELFSRVYQGTDEPVIYQGELCYQKDKNGRKTDKPLTIKRKSDTLLIFALKGKKPEVYRDNLNVNTTLNANLTSNVTLDIRRLNDEQRAALDAIYFAAAIDGSAPADDPPSLGSGEDPGSEKQN